LPEDDTDTGTHHLLIRRNDATGEHAYLPYPRADGRTSDHREGDGYWEIPFHRQDFGAPTG
jgi:hypothetical protein